MKTLYYQNMQGKMRFVLLRRGGLEGLDASLSEQLGLELHQLPEIFSVEREERTPQERLERLREILEKLKNMLHEWEQFVGKNAENKDLLWSIFVKNRYPQLAKRHEIETLEDLRYAIGGFELIIKVCARVQAESESQEEHNPN